MNSLRLGDELKLTSVAFPVDECAAIMIGAARDYGREHPASNVRLVRFVLFGAPDYDTFQQVLNRT